MKTNNCPERQQLLARFRAAFDEFSASVRELRAVDPPDEDLRKRSTQAQSQCEQLWAKLQEHQTKHRCWP